MENLAEIKEIISLFGTIISAILGVLALVVRAYFKKVDKINDFMNSQKEKQMVLEKIAEDQKRLNEKLDERLDCMERELAVIKSNSK